MVAPFSLDSSDTKCPKCQAAVIGQWALALSSSEDLYACRPQGLGDRKQALRSLGIMVREAIPASNLCFLNPNVFPIRTQHQIHVLEVNNSHLKGLASELALQQHFQ